MRLMRFGEPGREKPAVLASDESYVDVSDVVDDIDGLTLQSRLDDLRAVAAERVAREEVRPLDGIRVGAPIARPHQILCIGLNYHNHAAETGQAVPQEPILFTKAPNTLVGPNDAVIQPRGSTKLDWEVELGIVIGRRTSYLRDRAAARASIAGYMVCNDVSERAFQLERSGQWTKGKSAQTFNPAGPWLMTADEVEDVNDLNLWLDVNGQAQQRGNTASMIFDPYFIVHHLSQFMVLEPGDLINTGTPPGVAMGQEPAPWLAPGDVMELGISKLGSQRQIVVSMETLDEGPKDAEFSERSIRPSVADVRHRTAGSPIRWLSGP
jgi:2,4-diketo-3-deoxy-L-fuconate hydrolase